MTTKQKKTLKKDANNKTKTTKATQSVWPPQKCGKRHCGECNVALWIGFGFVPSSCLPKVLSFQVLAFQVLAFQVLAFQVLVFVSSVAQRNVLVGRKNTQEQLHGTKIPQLDLTFPPKEFTEYCHAYCTLRLDMMTSSCTAPAKHHTRPHDHEGFAKKQSHLPKVFLSSVTVAFKTRTLIGNT